MPKSGRYYIFLVVILGLSFLPGLRAGFLNWDDPSHLYAHEAVLSFDVPGMFREMVNGTYIPLTSLSFAIERKLFGMDPFFFHLDNILLHAAVTVLLMGFFIRLGASVRASFLGALLFAVHPMRVESVVWLTERKDVLYALFYVLALRQWWVYLYQRKAWDAALTLLWGLLSILSKPMALSLPLVLFFMDWWRNYAPSPMERQSVVPAYRRGGLGVYAIIAGFIWVVALPTYLHHARVPIQDPAQGILIWAWTLGFYIWKFFAPWILFPTYSLPLPVSILKPAYFLSLILVAAVAVFLWTRTQRRTDRWFVWAVGVFFLSIFFILRFDSVDTETVADRFMYLPCTGICIWLGVLADQALIRSRRLATIGLVVIFSCLIWLTFTYSMVWEKSSTFWSYLIDHCSGSFLCNDRGTMGRVPVTMTDQDDGLVGAPRLVYAYFDRGIFYKVLGNDFEQEGEADQAKDSYRLALNDFDQAIRLAPNYWSIYNSRALVKKYLNDSPGVIADLDKAIELNPFYKEAFVNRCSAHGESGRLDLALTDCLKAEALGSRSPELYNDLGIIYAHQGMKGLSAQNFQKAVDLDPGYEDARKNRAALLDGI